MPAGAPVPQPAVSPTSSPRNDPAAPPPDGGAYDIAAVPPCGRRLESDGGTEMRFAPRHGLSALAVEELVLVVLGWAQANMDCRKEQNLKRCTCSYSPCSRKGICCECLHYHLAHRQLPGCCFPASAEATYDRSFEHFARLVTQRLV